MDWTGEAVRVELAGLGWSLGPGLEWRTGGRGKSGGEKRAGRVKPKEETMMMKATGRVLGLVWLAIVVGIAAMAGASLVVVGVWLVDREMVWLGIVETRWGVSGVETWTSGAVRLVGFLGLIGAVAGAVYAIEGRLPRSRSAWCSGRRSIRGGGWWSRWT